MFPGPSDGSVGLSPGDIELDTPWESRVEPQQTGNVSLAAVDGIQGQKGRALGHESRLHKQVGAILEPGSESVLMRGVTHLGLVGKLLGLMGGSLVL